MSKIGLKLAIVLIILSGFINYYLSKRNLARNFEKGTKELQLIIKNDDEMLQLVFNNLYYQAYECNINSLDIQKCIEDKLREELSSISKKYNQQNELIFLKNIDGTVIKGGVGMLFINGRMGFASTEPDYGSENREVGRLLAGEVSHPVLWTIGLKNKKHYIVVPYTIDGEVVGAVAKRL